jgi:hypothetical protein
MKSFWVALLVLGCGSSVEPDRLTVSSSCVERLCTVVSHYPGVHDHLYAMEGRALTLRGADSIWSPWSWTRTFPGARDSSVFPLDFVDARPATYHLDVTVAGSRRGLDWTFAP